MAKKGKRKHKERKRELHPKRGAHGSAKMCRIEDDSIYGQAARRRFGRRPAPQHHHLVDERKPLDGESKARIGEQGRTGAEEQGGRQVATG